MSPKYLVAESRVSGRPTLLHSIVAILNGPKGEVVHEDDSGVEILALDDLKRYPVSFPFNYQTIADPPKEAPHA